MSCVTAAPNTEEAQRRIANWHDAGESLDISNLGLTELPHNLPAALRILRCNCNNITMLPHDLPVNLLELYCNNMPMTRLPDTLPARLEILSCNNTLITSLPAELPANLTGLYCNCTLLSSLPDKLPARVVREGGLFCYNTHLPDMRHGESSNDYYARIKREERAERGRCVRRLKAVKEELIAATWHTSRVVHWCGADFDWGGGAD